MSAIPTPTPSSVLSGIAGQSRPQLVLFDGVRLDDEGVERRYSFEQIATALRAANGNKSLAARYLGCSRNTIIKRVERNARLKAVLKEARDSYIDIAEAVIMDPLKRPCIYCRVPMLDSTQWFEICPGRRVEVSEPVSYCESTTRFIDGDLYSIRPDGHVALVNIDPTERRQIAIGILRTFSEEYRQDRRKPSEVPDELLDTIPDDQIPAVMKRLRSGERVEQIVESILLMSRT
jgi:Bacterial regulatory protein, Fis family